MDKKFNMLQRYNKNRKNFIFLLFCSLLLVGCAGEIDPITGKKKIIEPNADKKATANRDKKGGILGGRKQNDSNDRLLGNSNILWKASLNTLENIPLSQTDYSGGIIITDWYGDGITDGKNEQIKITLRFVSNELSPSSINVISYKKTCIQFNCKTIKLAEDFSNKIKDNILKEVRNIKIAQETKR